MEGKNRLPTDTWLDTDCRGNDVCTTFLVSVRPNLASIHLVAAGGERGGLCIDARTHAGPEKLVRARTPQAAP